MLQTSTTTGNDQWIAALGIKRAKISVLIIGNNPIEITSVYNSLSKISTKNYLVDVCFDVKDGISIIAKSKPEIILIDDNMPLDDIHKLVVVMRQNAKTKSIKVIALKSTNWNFSVINDVDDYILKDSVRPRILDRIIEKNLNPLEKHLV